MKLIPIATHYGSWYHVNPNHITWVRREADTWVVHLACGTALSTPEAIPELNLTSPSKAKDKDA